MTLYPLPAFNDNYIWTLHDGHQAIVVDPGDADGVTRWLQQHGLQLQAILITHHHSDHTGGVAALQALTGARVFGPVYEHLDFEFEPVREGDRLEVQNLTFEVMHVPGHTAGHVTYYSDDAGGRPLVFCGDTLFSAGCGRIFEGTPAQMLQSLQRLSALPDETRVCCAHEYTLSNLRFAQAVDPANPALATYTTECQALRRGNQPTLPSTIGLEKRINPFLRCQDPAVVRAALTHVPASADDELAVFTTLRQWKNDFA